MDDHDFTEEEVRKFGDVFAELNQARAHLEAAAKRLEERGYRERAHKVRGSLRSRSPRRTCSSRTGGRSPARPPDR